MAWTPKDATERLMFRPLDDAEETAFRKYALTHAPGEGEWTIYHPVCRAEWERQGLRPWTVQG